MTSAFSSSSYMAAQLKNYNDLNEYATQILNSKLPKPLPKDLVNEKIKKSGGWTPFNFFISNEMAKISTLINSVKSHLQIIKNLTDHKKIGWDSNNNAEEVAIAEIADSIYNQQIPKAWSILAGARTSIAGGYSLASFISDLSARFQHIDKCLTVGKEKMPAYNLSAFFNPKALLSLFKFEMIKHKNANDETGCVEPILFQTDMTSRDKEHVCLFFLSLSLSLSL